jgi:hypothetical protein
MKTKKILKSILKSREAMQKLLDEWMKLGLGPCMGLNDLIIRPKTVYDRAVKDASIRPDPSGLLKARNKALRLPYCAMEGIFIENYDEVTLNVEGLMDLNLKSKKMITNDNKHAKANIN